jgi:tetratricopeptide (TPR) repeat protein
MNRTVRITCLLALAWAAAALADRLRNVEPGKPVPSFSLKTLDGTNLATDSMKSKVLLLVFVSAEQRSSEETAIEAHKVFRDIRHDDLKLVFVTADVDRGNYFRPFRDKAGIHEPLALDPNRDFYGRLGLIVAPTTIIVGRDGNLAHVIAGHKSDYAHVLDTHARQALGLIDDAEAKKRLEVEKFQPDRLSDRAARHRAAARLLREKGLLADAENELKSALGVDPGNTEAGLDLASLYLFQKKNAEADKLIGEVLQADPNNRRGKLMRGIVLFKSNKLDAAETLLKESLLLNPDPARSNYYLGLLYEKKGDKDKALKHYREALSRLLDEPAD